MLKQQPSSSPASFPAWQREIETALKESDPKKVLEHVHAAEIAISSRLRELAENPNQAETSHTEQPAIAQALETLRALKRDKLGFPDWNGKA